MTAVHFSLSHVTGGRRNITHLFSRKQRISHEFPRLDYYGVAHLESNCASVVVVYELRAGATPRDNTNQAMDDDATVEKQRPVIFYVAISTTQVKR
jgi:hypothetical protein